MVPPPLEKWQEALGVEVAQWESCNGKAGRIWLNLELAKWRTIRNTLNTAPLANESWAY
jgi:hypothetical protein